MLAIFEETRKLENGSRWQLAANDDRINLKALLEDFGCSAGADLSSVDAPALTRVLVRSSADLFPLIGAAKDAFKRPRPFLEHEGPICVMPSDELTASPSYPSGHSAMGWLYALLLAEIDPSHADAIVQRGRAYGESRVVCGVHYYSDIEGGRMHRERARRGAARRARVRDRRRERTRRDVLAARQGAARGRRVREREGEPSDALVSAPPSAHVKPRRQLGVAHAVSVCVGMVIGAGIFKSTPLAAAVDLPSDAEVLALWVFGGAMSLAGALCFAELAAAFPDPGGDYFFLRKAYGAEAGFLFAWSRFAVIHTGSMAMLAFSFGDYLAAIADVGPYGSAAIAAATIVALAALNLAGLRFGIGTQLALMLIVIAGLLVVGGAGSGSRWRALRPRRAPRP